MRAELRVATATAERKRAAGKQAAGKQAAKAAEKSRDLKFPGTMVFLQIR